ncbi:hypothetical protein OK074_3536 [Actinobacteria bacterium OK074]|nr:hypothetical protein OK074_3536 [Actinobacteria bacterium OK074]
MIVVTGATGNVGRALVRQLVAEGRPVRAVTRDPRRADLPPGAEVTRLDPADPGALFTGASQLFLHVAAVGDRTADLLAAARSAGVRHVVLLSSGIIKEGADETHPIHVMHATVEQWIRDSGLAWTFLRPNEFAVNARQFAPQIRAGDTVRGPYAQAASAPIHEADIAAVALRTLLDDGHDATVHRLTGPEPVTNAGKTEAIGKALGRKLTYVEIPPEEAVATLYPHVPTAVAQALIETQRAYVGVQPEITDTVEKITGNRARTFGDWAVEHRDEFTP